MTAIKKTSQAFIYLLAFIAVISCNRQAPENCCADNNSAHCKPGEKSAAASAELSGTSIYNLESIWTDQDNNQITLSNLQGQVQIVALIYTRCRYACPRIIADLKRIESELSDTKDVKITLVTMDPEHDTAEQLKEFALENKLDDQKWKLLTGSPEDIMELAAVLQIRYKSEPDGEISHSNIITVLDRNGEIVHQQEGLGADPTETVNAVKKLQKPI